MVLDFVDINKTIPHWTHFACICSGACAIKERPNHFIVVISGGLVVFTATIILFLVYRRKPWATFDIDADKIVIRGKQLPNVISQSIYCLGIIFILIIDWVKITLDTLCIGGENCAG